jgi:hypothetical protein
MDLFLVIYGALCAWTLTIELLHTLVNLWMRKRYNQQLATLQGQIASGVLPPGLPTGVFPNSTPPGIQSTGQYL